MDETTKCVTCGNDPCTCPIKVEETPVTETAPVESEAPVTAETPAQ